MLLRIIGIVFPIFAIVFVGYIYGRRAHLDMSAANKMNMDVFLPALIFSALASKSFSIAANFPSLVGCIFIVVVSGGLAWLVARILNFDIGTLVPSVMFSNVGNMGLPLLALTFGDEVLGVAIVLLLVLTVMQFLLTPWIIVGKFSFSTFWREPIMLASVLGIIVSLNGYSVWPPVIAACKIVGDISIGLMIFSLGVRLSSTKFNSLGIGLAGAFMSPVTGLISAWTLFEFWDFPKFNQDVLYLFAVLPPAVSNFIFAERYSHEPDKVASIVVLGNMLSIIFIPLVLAFRL